MATIRPIIDTMFSVIDAPKNWRSRYMIVKTQKAETGMDIPMISVLLKFRRNRKMIVMARNPPRRAESARFQIPFVTVVD